MLRRAIELDNKMLCLSCSVLQSREVELSPACIKRHHALITIKNWRDRHLSYPPSDRVPPWLQTQGRLIKKGGG